MGQVHHGSATTTAAVRRARQHGQESLRALARRYAGEVEKKTIRGIDFPLTVRRYHYDSHEQLERHLRDFVGAYDFGRRLRTLNGLAPYDFTCKCRTSATERFKLDRIHQMPGLNTSRASLRGRIFLDGSRAPPRHHSTPWLRHVQAGKEGEWSFTSSSRASASTSSAAGSSRARGAPWPAQCAANSFTPAAAAMALSCLAAS